MPETTRRIIVAVDLVAYRDVAFDWALRLSRGWNAELHLLHRHPERHGSNIAINGQDLERNRSAVERSHLRGLVRAAEEEGVWVRVIGTEGDPARPIAAYAHLVMADLLVIAREYGSPRVWRTPIVTASVGRASPVAVLIVPSQLTASTSSATPFKRIVVAASAVAMRVATDVIAQGDGRATVVHVLPCATPMVLLGETVRRPGWHAGHSSASARGAARVVTPRIVRTSVPANVSARVLNGAVCSESSSP